MTKWCYRCNSACTCRIHCDMFEVNNTIFASFSGMDANNQLLNGTTMPLSYTQHPQIQFGFCQTFCGWVGSVSGNDRGFDWTFAMGATQTGVAAWTLFSYGYFTFGDCDFVDAQSVVCNPFRAVFNIDFVNRNSIVGKVFQEGPSANVPACMFQGTIILTN